jgi:hypothetical protein
MCQDLQCYTFSFDCAQTRLLCMMVGNTRMCSGESLMLYTAFCLMSQTTATGCTDKHMMRRTHLC